MPLDIEPPLINSANPWATTIDDLRTLYNCPHTGAVTIRTSLLQGFPHDPRIHQYTFFNPSPSPDEKPAAIDFNGQSEVLPGQYCSLNTLGYSPILFHQYISDINNAICNEKGPDYFMPRPSKPFIFSVTGSPEEICVCYRALRELQDLKYEQLKCMMEINLSCPNIPNKPPPAYSTEALDEYLLALSRTRLSPATSRNIPIGIKAPPYTHQSQFDSLLLSLKRSKSYKYGCPISFITSTNTLGSCLVLNPDNTPALSSATGTSLGGLAGPALHPLSLGNVATLRRMLDEDYFLASIAIIGVGGVSDKAGFDRMRAVGASVVAVGTALGREGISVFGKILGKNDENSKAV